jgi:hypothetical protein
MKNLQNSIKSRIFDTQRNATQRNATQRNATQRNAITLSVKTGRLRL